MDKWTGPEAYDHGEHPTFQPNYTSRVVESTWSVHYWSTRKFDLYASELDGIRYDQVQRRYAGT